MSRINDLHKQAMNLASRAELAQANGDDVLAQKQFREAFEREKEAALLVDGSLEPTRSILLRSAASLALDCGEGREAERLIGLALSGEPPAEIAEELRDLYESVSFERHLSLRGTVLNAGEMQMSLAGESVGFGVIPAHEYFPRIQTVESLLWRTAERQNQVPFREHGSPSKMIEESVSLYLSVPRAASYAVTIKVGRSEKQRYLFGEGDAVLEFLECIALFANERREELRDKIGDIQYYRNFIYQAKKLSPDGHKIRTVGFTAIYGEEIRKTALKGPPSSEWYRKAGSEKRVVELIGTITSAHKDESRPHKNLIGLRMKDRPPQTIQVPKWLMNDIVRPLWDRLVIATCQQKGNKLQLLEIAPFEE